MKRMAPFAVLLLMLLLCAPDAGAVDFKIRGQWWMGFTAWTPDFVKSSRKNGQKWQNTEEIFDANQRIRLQLEAAASESLSGTVQIQLGATNWGQGRTGGALGADGRIVKLRQAWLDFTPPQIPLKTRMGIFFITLPNAAGGPGVLDERMTGISTSYEINDNFGLTAFWGRPFNDNYPGREKDGMSDYHANYLDNLDLFSLILSMRRDGLSISPWAMFGIQGRNAFRAASADNQYWMAGNPIYTLRPYPATMPGNMDYPFGESTSKTYGNLFWAGLPIIWDGMDPWNFEFDFNYGVVESLGRYTATKYSANNDPIHKRSSTRREGWLAKALIEYKMDWGVPGILGWYSSGDDSNPKNGSERMPSIVPWGNFTSFIGDGNLGWKWQDLNVVYAGTWGAGIQIRDMSFIDDLTHTFRAVWWGGTNSPSMVKYMPDAYSWQNGSDGFNGPYMTTNDGMLEFNLVNIYKMYENFDINFEVGYIANFMDNGTWKKAGQRDSSFSKQDRYKFQLVFAYSF